LIYCALSNDINAAAAHHFHTTICIYLSFFAFPMTLEAVENIATASS
jgi:hypothetical protein